jgi:hypothetical protein
MMTAPAGDQEGGGPARSFPAWILLGALLLPCLYLPTLSTRFDFIDDGNLVYPEPPMPLGERLGVVWQKIMGNYWDLGPFRPVLWAHWEAEAELFGGEAYYWRLCRLAWLMLATAMFLWLFHELRFSAGVALASVALAIWSPYRSEIWTSLTLSEGVAMPYALLSLVCALRAARSGRPLGWELLGVGCVVAALGCKNTFAALVPVQFLLRVAPEGSDFRQGLRRHGLRAALMSLTLLLPIVHYIIFRITWKPGQYEPPGPAWGQLVRMLGALKRAMSLDFIGIGLALAVLALVVHGLRRRGADGAGHSVASAAAEMLAPIWRPHRAACLAGLGLLVFGMGIYLPIGAVAPRYSMPAAWGADLWLAALLSALAGLPVRWPRRLSYAALGLGAAVLLVANLDKQYRFAARAELLWRTLEYVEQHAPPGARLRWLCGPELDGSEGVHFQWHLERRRRRPDVQVVAFDRVDQSVFQKGLGGEGGPADLVISSVPRPGAGQRLWFESTVAYRGGTRRYHCYVWEALPAAATAALRPQ